MKLLQWTEWSVKQKETMVWGSGGCWDSGRRVQTGEGSRRRRSGGQSSQRRMEERPGAELWEFSGCSSGAKRSSGLCWQRDDATRKNIITHSFEGDVGLNVAARSHSVDTYFSQCASTFTSVWNKQQMPNAGKRLSISYCSTVRLRGFQKSGKRKGDIFRLSCFWPVTVECV